TGARPISRTIAADRLGAARRSAPALYRKPDAERGWRPQDRRGDRLGESVMRPIVLALAALLSLGAQRPAAPGWHLVPRQIDPQGRKGPDGNSIFIDAPQGLILVDTGRHPEHAAALLAYARERGRPIAAIFNTHWHLDHSTGNTEIRAAFPDAPLYASNA